MKKKPKIAIHQINSVTGDIDGNFEKILKGIEKDIEDQVEISVFPETAISGYMCGSLWDNPDFVRDQENKLLKIKAFLKKNKHEGVVILGFIESDGLRKNGFPKLYNSSIIINGYGKLDIYRKRILADADHHEDKKYFIAGRSSQKQVFDVSLPSGDYRIGVPVCEDMWYIDHVRKVPIEMVELYGADLIININQSYFYYGKDQRRHDLLENFATVWKTPVIYCNSAGVGDIVKNIAVFDGGSMAFNEEGVIVSKLKRFQEDRAVVSWPSPSKSSQEYYKKTHYKTNKYKEISESLMFSLKEFLPLCGIKKAQVHLSGGLDSSIVAALVHKALGRDNVVFITNPTELNNNSLKYVDHITKKLDNKAWMQPLQKIYDVFMEYSFGDDLNDTGRATAQAVLRTAQGLAACHKHQSAIIATGNHTEMVLGWATFHDIGSVGAMSLIGDLTKVELYQLSAYINDVIYGDEIIPYDLYNGKFKPSAELPDAKGEDPIDYMVQSGICAMLIRERATIQDLIYIHDAFLSGQEPQQLVKDMFPDGHHVTKYTRAGWLEQIEFAKKKMRQSVFKTAQAPPPVIISPRSRGFSNRETLINKYTK